MKWIVMCSAPVVLAGGLYLKPPGGTSETYPRTRDEAAFVLDTLQVPGHVRGMIESLPQGAITRDHVPGESVSLFFHARGKQAAKFVAEIDPVDPAHTRVTSRLTMADDAEALMTDRMMPLGKQFAVVGAVALTEQLDAQMERRAVDEKVVTRAMAGYAMANMGEIQSGASAAMDEAVKLQDEKHAQRASGVSFTPGQPMIDPSAPSR